MKNYDKYRKQYFMPPETCMDWAKKEAPEKPPVWCSVDLRDGNQALVCPMSLETKLKFFDLLVKIGFKEIEVGFPAASNTEYEFLRALINGNRIPDDVTIQVLTQARPEIIRKTFDAVRGAKNVIVHVYNSTSPAQRDWVFRKDREGIKKIACDGAQLLKDLAAEDHADYRFEYSPESFTGTEPEYALEVVNAVLDIWKPTGERRAVINLPATVEHSMPHVYAQQIEYMCRHMHYRENVVVSLHPHNDRGCAVAASEFGLLAGADRLEGTLFGNGERTGNADIVTVAMNLFSQGIDPGLDFSDMPEICRAYMEYTGMPVSDRQPYGGSLVFAAFSGSHQDAIAKGLAHRAETDEKIWSTPYLPIDPQDVGRCYDSDVIRINSQSGKGGVGYVMSTFFGFNMPAGMRTDFSRIIKTVTDTKGREISQDEIYAEFEKAYILPRDMFRVTRFTFSHEGESMRVSMDIVRDGGPAVEHSALGNGRLDAVSQCLKDVFGLGYVLSDYEEHAQKSGSKSKAISYVAVETDSGKFWGVGVDDDIIMSSCHALVSAVNNFMKA